MQNSGLQKDCVRDMNLFDLPLYSAEGHNGHLLVTFTQGFSNDAETDPECRGV